MYNLSFDSILLFRSKIKLTLNDLESNSDWESDSSHKLKNIQKKYSSSHTIDKRLLPKRVSSEKIVNYACETDDDYSE